MDMGDLKPHFFFLDELLMIELLENPRRFMKIYTSYFFS